MAWKTNSDVVRRAYETQMEDVGNKLDAMKQIAPISNHIDVPHRTAFDKSVELLKSPVSTWYLFNVHEQHQLFFFLFNAKLIYSKTEGCRTGDSLSVTRLFEEFAGISGADKKLINFSSANPANVVLF